jgi:acyl-CoA thioesterase-1
VPLSEVERNLDAILTRLEEHGVRALLLGMRLPPNYGTDYAQGFAEIFPRLAREHGVAFVPGFLEGVGGVDEMNLPDGLHPTTDGHARLAENVAPHLQALLEEE